ncbi:MAG: tetratricopeptide repeat protein [Candidatus Kapabacteria bacterium]|nr:tetratricopeptide repeat protein [Candidatus Kapabacteria bacterium]
MRLEQLQEKLMLADTEMKKGNYAESELLSREVLQYCNELPPGEAQQATDRLMLCAKSMRILGEAAWRQGDYNSALVLLNDALVRFQSIPDKLGIANVTANIGIVYKNVGSYEKALEYFVQALALHNELGEKNGIAAVTGNIGNVYSNLGSYDKALEYYVQALALNNERGDKSGIAIVTGNIGNVHNSLGSYDIALEYYMHALDLHNELGEKSAIARVTGNIGSVYKNLGSYDKALEYYKQTLELNNQLGRKSSLAVVTGNIGTVYAKQEFGEYDAAKAEEYLLKSLSLFEEIGAKNEQSEIYKSLADFYEKLERNTEAYHNYKKYHELEKEVQSAETKKQAERWDFERKQTERDKNLAVERAKHEATEQLLHNVLPPSIAHRMIAGESLIAEKLENVSVLFADIVGFTKLSSRISAEELVAGLDRIFSAFDTLAEKHRLEKIKTIGDAYMVVSGAPEPCEDHAQAMALMAIEMMEAMKEFRSISTGEEIQIRIGIHSGEVVAGVIGKKKFAYDLWGDAVNTAARMESHGEAGKIHISEEFKHAVETVHEPSLRFSPRGEMEIKGKGMMKTYFLEKLSEQD